MPNKQTRKDMKNQNFILELIESFSYLRALKTQYVVNDEGVLLFFEFDFIENKTIHRFSNSFN